MNHECGWALVMSLGRFVNAILKLDRLQNNEKTLGWSATNRRLQSKRRNSEVTAVNKRLNETHKMVQARSHIPVHHTYGRERLVRLELVFSK